MNQVMNVGEQKEIVVVVKKAVARLQALAVKGVSGPEVTRAKIDLAKLWKVPQFEEIRRVYASISHGADERYSNLNGTPSRSYQDNCLRMNLAYPNVFNPDLSHDAYLSTLCHLGYSLELLENDLGDLEELFRRR